LKSGPEVVRKMVSRSAQSEDSLVERLIGRILVMVEVEVGTNKWFGTLYFDYGPWRKVCCLECRVRWQYE
jgi:hypothetical protein